MWDLTCGIYHLYLNHQNELAAAFNDNDSLVMEYQRIQQCFMKEKAAALKVIERKLELETSLRDHVQVS